MNLSETGQKVFEARYAQRDDSGNIIETFEQAVYRLAKAAASAEKENREQWEEAFAQIIGDLHFVPSTPIWANVGKSDRAWQPGACFVLAVEDSLESMYQTLMDTAMVFKSGGGVGYNFSAIRPRGSLVRSTKGKASGVVELIKLYDASSNMVMQGGVRRGASMGILNIDHPEIEDFINAKLNGALTNFNLSVGVTGAFMEALNEDKEWPLVFGDQVYKVVQARDLWDKIASAAHACGDPGIIFIDRLQETNPVPDKVINATNPCFHPDTMVATDRGLERIEDLFLRAQHEQFLAATDVRVSGVVKVINGRDYFIPGVEMRPAKVFKTGRKPTVQVALKNGQEIKVTVDHLFLTIRGWVEASKLKTGDKVLVQSGDGSFAASDNIGVEMGYFLGWLTGDGWLTRDNIVGMVFGKDDEHLIPFFQGIAERHGGGSRKAYLRENGTWNVFWKRKDFIERLVHLGIRPVKAGEKRVPRAIFTARKETVLAFLQALFCADGTVANYSERHRDVRLCSVSKSLLQDVQLILLNLGIFSNIYERVKKNQKEIEYTTKDGELRVYSGGKYYDLIIKGNDLLTFKETVGFKLHPAKEEKLSKVARISRKSTKFISEVIAISPFDEVDVYDISEPETNSLIANGIVVHNCGEQPLSPGESCLLGSVNLARMMTGPRVEGGVINRELLRKTVETAVRFLDNLIDVAVYPLPLIAQLTRSTRKIGLGFTGLHDALIMAGLPYDSEEGRAFAGMITKSMQEYASSASKALAEEKGVFLEWENSIYYPDEKRRNAACITIAPTGSVTTMAGCEGYGVEPIFAVAYTKSTNVAGDFEVFSPLFLEACKMYGVSQEILSGVADRGTCQGAEGIPEKIAQIFKGAQDIVTEDHIMMQAEVQKYVDNAISKTVNLGEGATAEDIKKCYRMAYDLGLKGITVFRDGCKKGTIVVGDTKSEKNGDRPEGMKRGQILPRPVSAHGMTHRLDTGCGKIYLTVNYQPNSGEILETFITTGSDGGCLVYTEAASRLISLAIRGGIPVNKIIEQLVSTHACPSYMMARGKGKDLSPGKSCASAIAKKLAEIKEELNISCNGHGKVKPLKEERSTCECGEPLYMAEGCLVCRNCGYSKC